MKAALSDITSHLLRHPSNSSSFVSDRVGKEHPCFSMTAYQHWLASSATDTPEQTRVRCNPVLDGTLVGIPSSVRKVGRPRGHAKLAPTAKRNVGPLVLFDFSPSRMLPTFGRRMRVLTCCLTFSQSLQNSFHKAFTKFTQSLHKVPTKFTQSVQSVQSVQSYKLQVTGYKMQLLRLQITRYKVQNSSYKCSSYKVFYVTFFKL